MWWVPAALCAASLGFARWGIVAAALAAKALNGHLARTAAQAQRFDSEGLERNLARIKADVAALPPLVDRARRALAALQVAVRAVRLLFDYRQLG